jgi:hypothetical protein
MCTHKGLPTQSRGCRSAACARRRGLVRPRHHMAAPTLRQHAGLHDGQRPEPDPRCGLIGPLGSRRSRPYAEVDVPLSRLILSRHCAGVGSYDGLRWRPG